VIVVGDEGCAVVDTSWLFGGGAGLGLSIKGLEYIFSRRSQFFSRPPLSIAVHFQRHIYFDYCIAILYRTRVNV